MSLQILESNVDRVMLIDDDEAVRQMYRYPVEELDLVPEEVSGPIRQVDEFLGTLRAGHDAVVCDYHLTMKNYSPVDGDVIVAKLYRRCMPAILCSRYSAVAEKVRALRRFIPVILEPQQLSDESVREGFATCLREFSGDFSGERRPWRTLVRVERCVRVNNETLSLGVVVPGWNPHVAITCDVARQDSMVFDVIESTLGHGDIFRGYAQVNLGCDREQDLYITEWSVE
ncbi:response regulator [Burkholderia vietnamiensis]|uniref:response regulator n=1 Tax=Burkholderia vietnamiensis TaxID=60552 RepID=UPI001B917FD1|nr:response regulator [Burkholderia vietnamiensis]MBR8034713.1 response regulator [Burkholderia vietnamiensis]